jgi:hypothetical protein
MGIGSGGQGSGSQIGGRGMIIPSAITFLGIKIPTASMNRKINIFFFTTILHENWF